MLKANMDKVHNKDTLSKIRIYRQFSILYDFIETIKYHDNGKPTKITEYYEFELEQMLTNSTDTDKTFLKSKLISILLVCLNWFLSFPMTSLSLFLYNQSDDENLT